MGVPERKRIGDSLQKLRIRAGFASAKEFAMAVGINVDTYTGYEQGKGMFTYERAWELADKLNCAMDDLGGREWPPSGAPAFSDPRQERMNEDYSSLSDAGKDSASGAVHGIRLAEESGKSAQDGTGDRDEEVA